MTFEEYQAIDAVNISSLLEIGKSPQHYLHNQRRERPDKAAYALGRLAHVAVLEPARYATETAVYDGPVRRGKAFEAWVEESKSKLHLTKDEARRCEGIAAAVRRHRVASSYLAEGTAEVTITWRHWLGTECKSRLDWIPGGQRDVVVDLKTTRDAGERAFGNAAARYQYHTRAAFYCDAYHARFGRHPTFVLIAVESEAPHAVAVYSMPSLAIAAGRVEYERLLVRLRHCLATNEWPGICDDAETELQLPAWAYGGDDAGLVFPEESVEAAVAF